MSKKQTKSNFPFIPASIGLGILYLLIAPQNTYANNTQLPTLTAGNNGFTPVTGYPGSPNESYLGVASYPKGIRNNNPGNEKRGSSPWNGKIPFSQSTDPTFEQFISFPHGVRVTIYELKNNYIDAGYDTIDKIMRRYDPPGNTNYINYVSQRLGVGIHVPLTSNKETLRKLVQAIARFENDRKLASQPEVVQNATFDLAWSWL